MLPSATVPTSLVEVLGILRSCFTTPSFATLCALVTGTLGASGRRTVTAMWTAAGLARENHWSRAHRFFSRAVWDLDEVGLTLARVVVACFVSDGDLTVAVDDSLFLRYGKKIFGVAWQHDGSAKGRDGLGRGNCFVIVGIVVTVPFMDRPVCLPVLLRFHLPKKGPSKTEQARELVNLLASVFPGRTIHVVGDALYRGPAWLDLPPKVTFTTRLASNAVLYELEPPRTNKRGHPRWKGDRLGTPAELAAKATWHQTTVRIYGKDETVSVAEVVCLWWGSLHRTPVKIVLTRRADSKRVYDWALVSTDVGATGETIIIRYGSRWSVEQSIKDGKDLLGAGDAQSRLKAAVERTVPFTMLCLTILILWYAQTGQARADLAARRAAAPWYRRKHHVAVTDLLTAFRRARNTGDIAAQASPEVNILGDLTCEATAA